MKHKLDKYKKVHPNEVPESAGIFSIARYTSRESSNIKILYSGESENIHMSAKKAMTANNFDGHEHSIIYLILIEPEKKSRDKLLCELQLVA